MKEMTIDEVRAERLRGMEKNGSESTFEAWLDPATVHLQTGNHGRPLNLRRLMEEASDADLLACSVDAPSEDERKKARRLLSSRVITRVCDEFDAAEPGFYQASANYGLLFRDLHRRSFPNEEVPDSPEWALAERGLLTVAGLQESFHRLHAAGRLIAQPGVIRPLNEEQKNEVVAAAEVDGVEAGVLQYLTFAFGGNVPEFDDGVRGLFAQHGPLMTKAAEFVFENAYPGFVPSAKWNAYKSRHLAHRRIVTVAALVATWKSFTDSASSRAPERTKSTAPEAKSPEDFSDLGDGEVAELLAKTVRAHHTSKTSNPFTAVLR